MWALARYDLRLGEEEFWGALPKELFALLRQHRRRIYRDDWRFAFLASIVASMLGDGKGLPPTPDTLMPHLRDMD